MLFLLAFYYAGWLRYLLKGRHCLLLFTPMLGVPLPMAVAPVFFYLAASLLLRSIPLAIAAMLFGAAHVYVSEKTRQRCLALEGGLRN